MSPMQNEIVVPIDGQKVLLYPSSSVNAPLAVLVTGSFAGGAQMFLDACEKKQCRSFSLCVIMVENWDEDLSPWPHSPVLSNQDHFTGEADAFLAWVTEKAIPQAESLLESKPSYRIILGYSMAGLFSLYALYKTDAFAKAGCVSGSLWYPGFASFAANTPFARKPKAVYCSLGNREIKDVPPVLMQTGSIMQTLCMNWVKEGIDAKFEWNDGNHFQNPNERQARALRWLLANPSN